MRAVWITRFGTPDVLEVRESPDPTPAANEVRIKTRACGLNFAEMMARQGLYPDAPKPPCVVGYEVSGVIDRVGSDVQSLKEGDAVVGLTAFRGHSDTVCTLEHATRILPEGMTFEEAAALPVNYLTAYLMLFRVAPRLRPDSKVLIHMAAGGVGTAALQLCRTVPGLETFGTASKGKHDAIRAEGCTYPIDYRNVDYEEVIREKTHGRGVDLILDALGGADWKKGLRLLRPTGMLIAFGFANAATGSKRNLLALGRQALGIPVLTPFSLMNQNRSIGGFHLGHLWQEAQMVGEALDELLALYSKGVVKPHVDKGFSFEQAAEAHQYMQDRKNVGKILLLPG